MVISLIGQAWSWAYKQCHLLNRLCSYLSSKACWYCENYKYTLANKHDIMHNINTNFCTHLTISHTSKIFFFFIQIPEKMAYGQVLGLGISIHVNPRTACGHSMSLITLCKTSRESVATSLVTLVIFGQPLDPTIQELQRHNHQAIWTKLFQAMIHWYLKKICNISISCGDQYLIINSKNLCPRFISGISFHIMPSLHIIVFRLWISFSVWITVWAVETILQKVENLTWFPTQLHQLKDLGEFWPSKKMKTRSNLLKYIFM